MKIDFPQREQLPQLRSLWREAFGDGDEFLDLFFESGFSPDRCRCVTLDGQIAAALYWFDCLCDGRKIAYLYAIATRKSCRGKGLCAALMADTHTLFTQKGYAGAILVPGDEGLFRMYGKMGYETCSHISQKPFASNGKPLALRSVGREEYARLRRQLLPAGGVIQEGENLTFLEKLTAFYAGDGFVLCADTENGRVWAPELLGDHEAAPRILAALGAVEGSFRFPGTDRPFAMYRPLTDAAAPRYFGLAFD